MSNVTSLVKNLIIEICCYDVRSRSEETRILKSLNSMSDVYTNQVLFTELITYFNNTKAVGEEILKCLQNIQKNRFLEKYILYESLLYVTSSLYRKADNLIDEYNLLSPMLFKNNVDESEWGKEINNLFTHCYLSFPVDYKFYLQGMKKLIDLNDRAVMFYDVLKQISDSLGYTNDAEINHGLILHICSFNVKVVDEQKKIIDYLKVHGMETEVSINMYIEIMSTLKLIGWLGTKYYYEVLYKMAEKINYPKTTVSEDELIFHSCCKEIQNQKMLGPDERKTMVTYLEIFGQFLLPKNYVLLMQLFHETDGYEVSNPVYKKFYDQIHMHIKKLTTVV